MDVTRRCDYACRILRSAYRHGDSYVSVSDVSLEEGIPYAFARSIQHDLVKGGLVKTARGARGGLALNCDPQRVTLLEVLEAVQGPVSVSLCVVDPDYCEKQHDCAYHRLWQGADRLLNLYFSSITLKDLIEQGSGHPVIRTALSAPIFAEPAEAACAEPAAGSVAEPAAVEAACAELPAAACAEACARSFELQQAAGRRPAASGVREPCA